ncbi:B-cell receptor CD22 [Frankliniella fusca]|uniref:B-cell receptor CD22 n=1 Tax=Frankliniella fusca TaxID=407009 RepID=A0AAE1GUX4_9NEOP|nr:B-cell receptor CD22 [Frankliniella fusca]
MFARAAGLREVHLQTPLAVKAGTTVTLRCNYDLQDDTLYTVKWYKGRSEFFRFTPKELPNTQVFPLNGISVDVSTDFNRAKKETVFERDTF